MSAQGVPVVARGGDVLALVEDLIRLQAQQVGAGVDERGLARLRGADYRHALDTLDREGHVPYRFARPRGAFEVGVAEVPQLDDWRVAVGPHGPEASARGPVRAEIA